MKMLAQFFRNACDLLLAFLLLCIAAAEGEENDFNE